MIENKQTIQTRMLNNIVGKYDKTEGSFIYDIKKPVAIERTRGDGGCVFIIAVPEQYICLILGLFLLIDLRTQGDVVFL